MRSVAKQCIEFFSCGRATFFDPNELFGRLRSIGTLPNEFNERLAFCDGTIEGEGGRFEAGLGEYASSCVQRHELGFVLVTFRHYVVQYCKTSWIVLVA